MEPFALKYRPATFSEMIGQKITATVLARMVETGRVPSGLLFAGPRGSGKTSAARILSSELDADAIEVDAASNGSVESVRQMIDALRYSTGSEHRVVIYDEAHSMSREAYNALLKTLEEPPSGTIFVLVTTEPEKIPETVKSRLMEFVFSKVSPAEIYDRLVHVFQSEQLMISDALMVLIAERADGSVRDALNMLDQCHRADIEDVETFKSLNGERDEAPRLIAALMSGNHDKIFSVAADISKRTTDPSKISGMLIELLRDLLVIRSGGELSMATSAIEARRELTLRLEPERILAALKLLWDLRTKIRSSTDTRGNLDLMLVLVSEIFTRGKQQPTPVQAPPPAPPKPERRLTLDEL